MNELNLPIVFTIFCIDRRFDFLTSEYFNNIGLKFNYYLVTSAGSSLSLGYKNYCNNFCKCKSNYTIDPNNPDIEILKNSIIKNLDISMTLDNIEYIYILNHQDCGAMKAYLPFSNYPSNVGYNNSLDIEINTSILLYSKHYIEENYNYIKNIRLGIIDINGSVADFDIITRSWKLVYRGKGKDNRGLWFGM